MTEVPHPRVLLVCERLPLPVRGGADLRILAVVQALARSARVGVVGLVGAPSTRPPHLDYWAAGGCALPDTPALLRQMVEHPDQPFGGYATEETTAWVRDSIAAFAPTVVVYYRLQTWAIALSGLRDVGIPTVLDLDESAWRAATVAKDLGRSDPASRLRTRFAQALARFEAASAGEASEVWVSAEPERVHVARQSGAECIRVVPNVVDVPAYERPWVEREPRRVVFAANFAYPPNEDAAREIIHGIAPALPRHRFHLVGSHIPAWMRAVDAPNVFVAGPVEDMVEHLVRASVAAMPIRAGTGTRLKILECLAAGTPVVSTAIGAEGLHLDFGRDLLRAETAAEFADCLVALDREPDRAHRIAAAGAATVRQRYSIDSLAPMLATAVDGLTPR